MRAFASEVNPEKFIFYYFECTQENGIYVQNFVVVQSVCSQCQKKSITEKAKYYNCGSRCHLCDKYDKKEKEWERNPCDTCSYRQVIFNGSQTGVNFCKWLISEQH